MLRLYTDVHVPAAITRGLRLRGFDVLTAQEDGAARLSDPDLLDRATELGRVLFSQDDDLLVEAAGRQARGQSFFGVIYCHQNSLTIGRILEDLELLLTVLDEEEMSSSVQYLPVQ